MATIDINVNPHQPLDRMARLPRETIGSILEHVDSLKYLAPFLVCGLEWFGLAVPLIWKTVCTNAITFTQIDRRRREVYASHIQAFLDPESCGCRRCMVAQDQRPHYEAYEIQQRPDPSSYVLPSYEDILAIQSIETFPRLRTLQLDSPQGHPPVNNNIARHISRSAPYLRALYVSRWGRIRKDDSLTLWDMLSWFHHLEYLEIDECLYHETPTLFRPKLHMPKLIAAKLFCFEASENPLGYRRTSSLNYYPCATLLDALADAPNLRQLQVFISRSAEPGTLIRPKVSWTRTPKLAKQQPFPALEELRIAIERSIALEHLPEVITLTRLTVWFEACTMNVQIMDILRQIPQLKHLKVAATDRDRAQISWMEEFTVADIATAIRPMRDLQSLVFNFPADKLYSYHHINKDKIGHSQAAHKLLLEIATNNPGLKELHLGFNLPFPLPDWSNTLASQSSLQVLGIRSYKPYRDWGEDELTFLSSEVVEEIRKLRRIFPEIRTFVSEKDSVQYIFS